MHIGSATVAPDHGLGEVLVQVMAELSQFFRRRRLILTAGIVDINNIEPDRHAIDECSQFAGIVFIGVDPSQHRPG